MIMSTQSAMMIFQRLIKLSEYTREDGVKVIPLGCLKD